MDDEYHPEILNLAAALGHMGGDSELLEEVARLFLDAAPGLLQRIRTAIKKADAAALLRAAHTMKGSVANFGAEGVFLAAFRLEQMARSEDLSGAEEAYATLEAEMKRLQPALAALVEKPA